MVKLLLISVIISIICLKIQTITSTNNLYTSDRKNVYYIENQSKYTWFDAFTKCLSMNMSLATIDTKEKSDDITNLLSKTFGNVNGMWIGAIANGKDHHYIWTSTGNEMTFSNWSPGEPNFQNSQEYCVLTGWTNQIKWNDGGCYTSLGLICDYNENSYKENESSDKLCEAKLQEELAKEQQLQSQLQKELENEQEFQNQLQKELEKEQKLQNQLQKELENVQQLQSQLQKELEKEQQFQSQLEKKSENEQELQYQLQRELEKEQELQNQLQKELEKEQQLQSQLQKELEKEQQFQSQLEKKSENEQELQHQLQKELENEQKLQSQLDQNQLLLEMLLNYRINNDRKNKPIHEVVVNING